VTLRPVYTCASSGQAFFWCILEISEPWATRNCGFEVLTKSKFMNGLQCDVCSGWPAISLSVCPHQMSLPRHISNQGHEVDLLAKDCILTASISLPVAFMDTINKTKAQLGEGAPYFRLDSKLMICIPSGCPGPDGKSGWELIEVKSSTEVKLNTIRVAFQDTAVRKRGFLSPNAVSAESTASTCGKAPSTRRNSSSR